MNVVFLMRIYQLLRTAIFFLRITKTFNYLFTKEILMNVNKSGVDRMSKNFSNIGLSYNIFIDDHLAEIDKDQKLQKKCFALMG